MAGVARHQNWDGEPNNPADLGGTERGYDLHGAHRRNTEMGPGNGADYSVPCVEAEEKMGKNGGCVKTVHACMRLKATYRKIAEASLFPARACHVTSFEYNQGQRLSG